LFDQATFIATAGTLFLARELEILPDDVWLLR